MIVIINGPLGVGKTETSDALLKFFERGVMLDGDYLGAVTPFDLYDPKRVEYLYQTMSHVIAFHKDHGYPDFVINYVFETPASLKRLKDLLAQSDDRIYSFRLACELDEIERRIRTRSQDPERLGWEVLRAAQLVEILEKGARQGDLGYPIESSHLSAAETAQLIWDTIHEEIILKPYNPDWAEAFELEKTRIQAALGEIPVEIHHIGSTAVPGLDAKPIIDLMLVVPALEDAVRCIQPLQALGYTFIDHPENVDRQFFRKGSPRTHHLHIVARDFRRFSETYCFSRCSAGRSRVTSCLWTIEG